MTSAAELGPIVGLGRVEQAVRDRLREPQVFGVYLDEALRQTYATETRVIRPKDIVASTEDRLKLRMPAIVVQAEGAGDPTRTRDRSYTMSFVVGVHCITTGAPQPTLRRTSDVMAAAATSLLLQRLPGTPVGPAVISDVTWDANGVDDDDSAAFMDIVTQLRIVVSGVASDRRGRIPGLPPNEPGTTGPAPPPAMPPAVVGFAVDVDDEDEYAPYEPEELL